jgi:hypothetical protein
MSLAFFPLLAVLAGIGPDRLPDRFPLFPTMGNEGASGLVLLQQPWSPYGVSVDEHGRVLYDLRIVLEGIPKVAGEVYRVWLTTPTLTDVEYVGQLEVDGELGAESSHQQLMVVVSRESADGPDSRAAGAKWSGPIILRGFSAGARVTPLAQHSLFQPSPM